MKNVVLGFLVCISTCLIGQDVPEKLAELDISNEQMLESAEKLNVFPWGFMYDLNQPDKLQFLGCFATNNKTVKLFFKKKKAKR